MNENLPNSLSRNPRFFSGLLTAVLSGFLTVVFLEPLFADIGLDIAEVALWILAINASLVGMSFGVLLPSIFPGICVGYSITLFVGTFARPESSWYLPIAGSTLALVGAVASSR